MTNVENRLHADIGLHLPWNTHVCISMLPAKNALQALLINLHHPTPPHTRHYTFFFTAIVGLLGPLVVHMWKMTVLAVLNAKELDELIEVSCPSSHNTASTYCLYEKNIPHIGQQGWGPVMDHTLNLSITYWRPGQALLNSSMDSEKFVICSNEQHR